MGQLLLLLVGVLVVAGIGFGVVVLITSGDPGLGPAEPDGRAVPLPAGRPLAEADIAALRFDTALRGYRMAQVDAALRRTAYDLGYKEELITVLMAEVDALRAGRREDAELLREARDQALAAARPAPASEPAIVIPAAATDAATDTDTDAEIDAARDADEAVEAERAAERAAGHAAERAPDDAEAGEPPDWSVELDDSWRRSAMGGR
jgi:DivIVA domain-containing protein